MIGKSGIDDFEARGWSLLGLFAHDDGTVIDLNEVIEDFNQSDFTEDDLLIDGGPGVISHGLNNRTYTLGNGVML